MLGSAGAAFSQDPTDVCIFSWQKKSSPGVEAAETPAEGDRSGRPVYLHNHPSLFVSVIVIISISISLRFVFPHNNTFLGKHCSTEYYTLHTVYFAAAWMPSALMSLPLSASPSLSLPSPSMLSPSSLALKLATWWGGFVCAFAAEWDQVCLFGRFTTSFVFLLYLYLYSYLYLHLYSFCIHLYLFVCLLWKEAGKSASLGVLPFQAGSLPLHPPRPSSSC